MMSEELNTSEGMAKRYLSITFKGNTKQAL
jgi:hypothetical protein